jgi:hypothetical protein
MKLSGSVHDVGELTRGERDDVFRLMERNYVNMRRRQFDSDLDAKSWVILVRSPDSNRIVGFSTQVILRAELGGEQVHALYSGDTVVDREYWGDTALASTWGSWALQLTDLYPRGSLFWFLTSKGFRTYRYLPLFFRAYYPRLEIPTPALEGSLISVFGQQVAGDSFDPVGPIIRAAAGKEYVRHEIAEPGRRLSTDPHVRFFVERNPGFVCGDELCCIAPLTRENFTRAANRVIGSGSPALNRV